MEKEKSHSALWITLTVAMPPLYVLSIGPVAWILKYPMHYAGPPKWLEMAYSPLIFMAEKVHWFEKLMGYYLKLWGV